MRTRKILQAVTFRKALLVPLVAGATAIIVATSASASPVPLAPRMSAATLANGILFDQGPAAGYMSGFFTHGTPRGASATRLEVAVDAALASAGPAATTFASQIQSGNRLEVQQALYWLGQLLNTTMNKLYGPEVTSRLVSEAESQLTNTPSKVGGDAPGALLNTLNVVYKVGQIVVVVQGAAVVETAVANAIIVLTLAVFFFSPVATSPQTQLSAQEFVNTIAVHLKAAQ